MSTRSLYREIFRIQCLHGYFRGRIWDALEVRPSAACESRLVGSRCLFRQLPSAGVVLAEVKPDGVTLIDPFTDSLPFTFYVDGPRAQLATLSDIGTQAGTQAGTPAGTQAAASPEPTALYFSNLSDCGTDVGGGTETYRLLHDPASQLAAHAISVRPARCMIAANAQASAALELFDVFGNSVWKGQSPPVAMTRLSLNLTGVADGRYRLQIAGVDQPPFYLCGTAARAPWAIVDIFPGGPAMKSVPAACRVAGEDGTAISRVAFGLPVPPARSVWRYYIISTSSADRRYDDFSIAGGPPRTVKPNGSAPITFSPPVKQALNGLDAWVFESDDPVPLYEYPGDHFALTLSRNGKGSGPPPTPLPYAQAETSRLGKTLKNQTQNLSEIFVYL